MIIREPDYDNFEAPITDDDIFFNINQLIGFTTDLVELDPDRPMNSLLLIWSAVNREFQDELLYQLNADIDDWDFEAAATNDYRVQIKANELRYLRNILEINSKKVVGDKVIRFNDPSMKWRWLIKKKS